MRKIVDANYFRHPALDKYLSSSEKNYVVLTEYASMEAYKGNTLKTIFKSMQILRNHPNQVIVLKGARKIAKLNTKGKGLVKRLIDHDQTNTFSEYCRGLKLAEKGNKKAIKSILELGDAANEHMDNILDDSKAILTLIPEISKAYSDSELRIIRKREPYSEDIIRKILYSVMIIFNRSTANHPDGALEIKKSEIHNSYIFRYALCLYLLVIRWISDGGIQSVKPERMRNDTVDMSYAAYATYFDGLLSRDNKAKEMYLEASVLLDILSEANMNLAS